MGDNYKDPSNFHELKTKHIIQRGDLDRLTKKHGALEDKFDKFYEEEYKPLRDSYKKTKQVVDDMLERSTQIKNFLKHLLYALSVPFVITLVQWVYSLLPF